MLLYSAAPKSQTEKSVQQQICGKILVEEETDSKLPHGTSQERNKVNTRTSTTPGSQRSQVEVATGGARIDKHLLLSWLHRREKKTRSIWRQNSPQDHKWKTKEMAREQYFDDR